MTDHPAHGSMALGFFAVSFAYGTTPVLEGVNFHLHGGEFAVLIGPNGAGKTTILRLLLGLAQPQAGKVEILGQEPRTARRLIGYVPQHADWDRSFPISVEEVVRMGRLGMADRNPDDRTVGPRGLFTPGGHSTPGPGASLRGQPGPSGLFTPGSSTIPAIPPRVFRRQADRGAVARALELADIADLARRPYTALSGGQRRRVLIARALASEPAILVLDEPTANMDSESEARLYQTLGRLKGSTTILMVTHDTAFVSSLTDVVLCVGEHIGPGGGSSVVRHASVPSTHAPRGLYGGTALRVLHDQDLPDTDRCSDCGHRLPSGDHP